MFKSFFRKWSALSLQRQNGRKDGPIGPGLDAMARLDSTGRPVSPIGKSLAGIIGKRGVRVLFMPTGGGAAAPWSEFVVYDVECRGEGQTEPPSRVGLIAHELTHVLQRDLNDPDYWPNGCFRPSRFTRWIGDSTNYMEVLAYVVGLTVEYDLKTQQLKSSGLSEGEIRRNERITDIERDVATLTGMDARNATRYILKMHPGDWSYKQNYRKEYTIDDKRIPPGGWDYWLIRFGFSQDVIDHIRQVARKGRVVPVDPAKTDEIAEVERLYGRRRHQLARNLIGLAKEEMMRRFNRSLGAISIFVVLYFLAHYYISPIIIGQSPWVQYVFAGVEWIWWVGIGAAVATVSSTARTTRNSSSRNILPAFDWLNLLFVGISTSVLLVLLLMLQTSLTLDLSVGFAKIGLGGFQVFSLPSIAFAVGFFYQLLSNFIRIVTQLCAEGFIAPFFQLFRRPNKGAKEREMEQVISK